jgi:hypothetical protein
MKEEITNAINNILDGRPTAKPYQRWEKTHREYLIENLGQLVLDYYNKALQVNQRYDTLGGTPLTFKPTTQQSLESETK